MQNEQKIKCPECGKSISLDDALTRQIEDKIRNKFSEENRIKEDDFKKQKNELDNQKKKFEETKRNTQTEIDNKVAEKLEIEKIAVWKKAQTDAGKEKASEIQLLQEQIKAKEEKLIMANTAAAQARADRQKLEEDKKNFEIEKAEQLDAERKKIEEVAFARAVKQTESNEAKLKEKLKDIEDDKEAEKKRLETELVEKDKKLREANANELILRKEKNKLEEERQNFEIEKQRQLDEERGKIYAEASQKAVEEQQYTIAQLNKKLADATKAKDELARKLEQGSEQTQGEVLELELEELLKGEFPQDKILPVPKGIKGADIVHKIIDRSGRICGQIVWESKKTKAWSEGWIQKLKDDQRAIKADIAVIVSAALPESVKGFVFRDGIWICEVKLILALATALRVNLEAVNREKMMAVGKNEKMEILYSYLTGIEFRQRIEAIVEAFANMQEGLRKERTAYEKIWAQREKQIQKVIASTSGMYGDLSGLVTLQQIKMLELDVEENTEGKLL